MNFAGEDESRQPTINSIIDISAQFFDVNIPSLRCGKRGKRNLPRAITMALCHQPGGYSLEEIAEAFGVRQRPYRSPYAASRPG